MSFFDRKLAEWVAAGKSVPFQEFLGMDDKQFQKFLDDGLLLSKDKKMSAHYKSELRRRELYKKKVNNNEV